MGYPDRVTVCISSQAGCAMGCDVLRHRPDGPAEQPHRGRDRRAGGVGAPRSGAPARVDATAAHERRVHGDGGALRERTTRLRLARAAHRPGRVRARARVTSRSRRSGSCPGSSGWPSARRRSGSRSASMPRATSCAIELVPPNTTVSARCGSRPRSRTGALHTRRRPSIEWALIDRVNDTTEQAELLAPIARRLGAHVNLIPLNPTPGYPVLGPPPARIRRFVETLERLRRERHRPRHARPIHRRRVRAARPRDRLSSSRDGYPGNPQRRCLASSSATRVFTSFFTSPTGKRSSYSNRIVPLPVTRSPSSFECFAITAMLIGNKLK